MEFVLGKPQFSGMLTLWWVALMINFITFSSSHVSSSTTSPNSEANALLKWKASFDNKSQALLSSWSGNTSHPYNWVGITCDEFNSISNISLQNHGLRAFAHLSFIHCAIAVAVLATAVRRLSLSLFAVRCSHFFCSRRRSSPFMPLLFTVSVPLPLFSIPKSCPPPPPFQIYISIPDLHCYSRSAPYMATPPENSSDAPPTEEEAFKEVKRGKTVMKAVIRARVAGHKLPVN
ncbi:uncharacterized protein LOC129319546 [Prosopis cineraria]|uniref:uncharacterized protein LOC129319546 n=1 Tax=Prosopis cineraria TaxID=364024 RepID=UPI0024104BFF|nr:uncharacterized protein LOC129319546 [Prosopis cineraria]